MSDHGDILSANQAFYAAFAAFDLEAMSALWQRDQAATCIHPGWERCRGWPAVLHSWRLIFAGGDGMDFRVDDVDCHVVGDVGRVHCVENIFSPDGDRVGRVVATNVFVRSEGAWRMVLHHGSVSTAPPQPDRQLEFH
jgi:ketosteroid isomerase-like protein